MVLMKTMLKHLMFFSKYTIASTCSTSAKSDAIPTCALFVECDGVDKARTKCLIMNVSACGDNYRIIFVAYFDYSKSRLQSLRTESLPNDNTRDLMQPQTC
jgi:hypothetical protein